VVGLVNGELLLTEVCRLGRVLIGGSVIVDWSKGDRVILTCDEGEFAVEGRLFCSFLGGEEVSRKEIAAPPNDIRRVKELDRL
jgi:hypothetical protein